MRRSPSFGFGLPIFAGSGGAHLATPLLDRIDLAHLRRSIAEAEALGFDSLWVADHFMHGIDSATLEGWTTMAWAAGATSQMRIGSIHLAHLFRNPALTAKMAATLDVISNGRLDFFYEAGHPASRNEVEAYGFQFPPDDNMRLDAFVEAVRVVKAMWTQDEATFDGRYFKVEKAICFPKPAQKPHPPIWIGTFGGAPDGRQLPYLDRLVKAIAEHADGWNSTPVTVSDCRSTVDGLMAACRQIGRDPGSLRLSLETQVLVAESPGQVRRIEDLIRRRNPNASALADMDALRERLLIGDADSVVKKIEQYVDLGIDTFQVWFMDYPSPSGMRTFASRVMPYFRSN